MLHALATQPDVLAPMRSAFWTVGTIVAVIGLGVLIAWFLHTFWGRKRVTGTVTAAGSTFGRHGGRSGTRLTISYEVEDEACEITAETIFGSWSEGESVTVRYVPGLPSDGIMPTAFFAVVGLFLCALGSMFVIIAITVKVE